MVNNFSWIGRGPEVTEKIDIKLSYIENATQEHAFVKKTVISTIKYYNKKYYSIL